MTKLLICNLIHIFLYFFIGNVEDLGLYFTIDEEVNGKVISKDLMGGSRVTDDNKIQVRFKLLILPSQANQVIYR
jgi:hypothetical protein